MNYITVQLTEDQAQKIIDLVNLELDKEGSFPQDEASFAFLDRIKIKLLHTIVLSKS